MDFNVHFTYCDVLGQDCGCCTTNHQLKHSKDGEQIVSSALTLEYKMVHRQLLSVKLCLKLFRDQKRYDISTVPQYRGDTNYVLVERIIKERLEKTFLTNICKIDRKQNYMAENGKLCITTSKNLPSNVFGFKKSNNLFVCKSEIDCPLIYGFNENNHLKSTVSLYPMISNQMVVIRPSLVLQTTISADSSDSNLKQPQARVLDTRTGRIRSVLSMDGMICSSITFNTINSCFYILAENSVGEKDNMSSKKGLYELDTETYKCSCLGELPFLAVVFDSDANVFYTFRGLRTAKKLDLLAVPELWKFSHLRPEFQKEYFVVLSSPNTLSQLFLLPLVVLGWQNIGAHSLVFFAGTSAQFEQSRVSQYIVDFLNDIGARTSFVSSNSLLPEVLAGLVRLFAVGMPRTFKFDDNSTVLVTADAHMLPLSIDEHTLQQPEEHLKVYGGRTRTRYALNTLTMTTAHWRQLMSFTVTLQKRLHQLAVNFAGIEQYGIDNGDAIYRYLAKEFGKKAMTELINDPDKKLDEILAGRKNSELG
uniref:Uncharacterized protein n=1 Tax=Ditylenchus dipsaci TaxID=166011 RepID=A0A915E9X2_9BILA